MEGKKTGGRQAGTPNKATQDVIARLSKLKCDPIVGMAKIALDDNNPPELRGRMFAELAQYIAPKRKAVEHSGDVTQTHYVARIPSGAPDMETWQNQHGDRSKNPTLQ